MTEITQKQRDLALKAESMPNKRIWGLFPLICQREWMMQAMWNVLHNKGAETAGVDGAVKVIYYDAKTRNLTPKAIGRIEEICQSLKEDDYHPQPARRVYIPKANGRMRPIGISTLDDRIVQEAIRMAIEPIYESDFLNCSYGFRPNRCTMDAIAVCYQRINPTQKYYWAIEGDIKGCFDTVDHKILMKLLRNRIADRKLTDTIYKFLKAGYQVDGVMHKPNVGTPQGSVLSPLMANVYLHEFDKWWSRNYDLDVNAKSARRRRHQGNFILTRYADDFIILSNGTKQATENMKERVARFLEDELKLELSQEKTAITHATEGFDFLGFHIRKYRNMRGVLIKPSKDSVQRVKGRIGNYLNRKKHEYAVVNVIRALNPVIRGWANYYRFVNSYRTLDDLDLFLNKKFLKWYRGKYQLPRRRGTMEGLKWINKNEPFHLCQFTETKVKRYKWKRKVNPYIEMSVRRMTDSPSLKASWYGNAKQNADLRLQCFQRDKGVCQICLRPKTNIVAHHVIPVSKGGEDTLDNMATLCEDCHREYHKELHYENRSWHEIKQQVGSRVHGNGHARFRREGDLKHANEVTSHVSSSPSLGSAPLP
ncbi:MAG: group II intron reverse transcriptase/maturase [Candidatus Thorarchaeota archaeon]